MKIQPSVPGLEQGQGANGAKERSGINGGAAATTPAQGDTIHLSALSSQLQALEATLAKGGGEFDRVKVEAIKEAIREGRLVVDAEVVADRLLATALAMMRKDPR